MRTRHLVFDVGALAAALGWCSVGPAQAEWVHEGQAGSSFVQDIFRSRPISRRTSV